MQTQMQSQIAETLAEARRRTDELFQLVRPDALYDRPIPERHRLAFYIGHMEAFDWNLLGRRTLDLPAFHSGWDQLFAFGIDPPPGEVPSDRPSDWPSLAEIERYKHRVRDELDDKLEELPEQLLRVAIEHRLMHAETLAYILHSLPYEKKTNLSPAPESRQSWAQPVEEMIEIPAGPARLGRSHDEGFGWDNEFDAHSVHVPAFSIAKYKVTNGDYLEFVAEGAAAPFFWTEKAGRWFYRGMFSEIPLPLTWPVYVTLDEARAYAAWRGLRLPTEAEFHRAARPEPRGNFDFRQWDPIPVNQNDGTGPSQMYGNGWEWTSTVFAPFAGFAPFAFYPNYSEPFFDGKHYVLKGASPRTAACFLRESFRNWFRPSYPYLYATFRVVES
jgi:iron(II)-dependent oxidoreductase